MILFDSNILIYSGDPGRSDIRNFVVSSTEAACSIVTRIEVLGYHKLSVQTKLFYEALFEKIIIHPLNDLIVEKAIILKQVKSLSLGDAIIAATALINSSTLVTNNPKDFQWIDGLTIVNPIQR